jgi:hypothetical protein
MQLVERLPSIIHVLPKGALNETDRTELFNVGFIALFGNLLGIPTRLNRSLAL